MKKYLLTIVLSLLPLQGHCDPPTYARCVISRWHDADTFYGTLYFGFGVSYTPAKGIRAYGYDAWEINKIRRTVKVEEAEILRGEEALSAIKELVSSGSLFVQDTGKEDPYGRASCTLWLYKPDKTWINVAQWMVEHGHDRNRTIWSEPK